MRQCSQCSRQIVEDEQLFCADCPKDKVLTDLSMANQRDLSTDQRGLKTRCGNVQTVERR